MKRKFMLPGAILALMMTLTLLTSNKLHAQTTLVAGDLLFTGFNGDASSAVGDTFSFVVMRDIAAGTVIRFTDRGFQNPGWQGTGGTESSIAWTVGAALTTGSEVVINGLTARSYNPVSASFTTNGTVILTEGASANGLSLSNVGDQIIAFQSTNVSPSASGATFIAGIHYLWCNSNTSAAAWDVAPCTYGPSSSAMPPGLSATVSAFYTGRVNPTTDPSWAYFNCPATMPTSPIALRQAILNPTNWTRGVSPASNPLPTRCNYSSIVLPIHLLSFQVQNQGSANKLSWESAKETVGDKFVVERSFDGSSFVTIKELPAKVNAENAYTYTDDQPLKGNNFYRLLMLNVDGTQAYSKTLSAFVQQGNGFNLSIYPNPTTDLLNITVHGELGDKPEITLTDVSGRVVAIFKVLNSSLNISITNLTAGIYYVQYTDSRRTEMLKVVKQ